MEKCKIYYLVTLHLFQYVVPFYQPIVEGTTYSNSCIANANLIVNCLNNKDL